MPLIVEYNYADGTSERVSYPVQIWRKNDSSVKKVVASDKELVGVTVDPDLETADVNLDNNNWPKRETPSDFEKFKDKCSKIGTTEEALANAEKLGFNTELFAEHPFIKNKKLPVTIYLIIFLI